MAHTLYGHDISSYSDASLVYAGGLVKTSAPNARTARYESSLQQQMDEVIQHALRDHQSAITGLSALGESLYVSIRLNYCYNQEYPLLISLYLIH